MNCASGYLPAAREWPNGWYGKVQPLTGCGNGGGYSLRSRKCKHDMLKNVFHFVRMV
jgi:hypothetical protein